MTTILKWIHRNRAFHYLKHVNTTCVVLLRLLILDHLSYSVAIPDGVCGSKQVLIMCKDYKTKTILRTELWWNVFILLILVFNIFIFKIRLLIWKFRPMWARCSLGQATSKQNKSKLDDTQNKNTFQSTFVCKHKIYSISSKL